MLIPTVWLDENGHTIPYDPFVDHPMCPCGAIPTRLVEVDENGKLVAGDPNDRWVLGTGEARRGKTVRARYDLYGHPTIGEHQYDRLTKALVRKGTVGVVTGAAWAGEPGPGEPIRVGVRWNPRLVGTYKFTEGKGRQPLEVIEEDASAIRRE